MTDECGIYVRVANHPISLFVQLDRPTGDPFVINYSNPKIDGYTTHVLPKCELTQIQILIQILIHRYTDTLILEKRIRKRII